MLVGTLQNGAVDFFLLFLEFSLNIVTFTKWIVHKNDKCKIVSPPILSNFPKIFVVPLFCTLIGEYR